MNWLTQWIDNWKNRHYNTCWNWLSEGPLVGRQAHRAEMARMQLNYLQTRRLIEGIRGIMYSSFYPDTLPTLWDKVVVFRLDSEFPDSFLDECLESSIYRAYKRWRMEPYPTAKKAFRGQIPGSMVNWLFETSPCYWKEMLQDGALDDSQMKRLAWRSAQWGDLELLRDCFITEPQGKIPDYLLRTCAKAAWEESSGDYVECIKRLGYASGLDIPSHARSQTPLKRKVKKTKRKSG
jgi:hypothetical protein